MFIMNGRTTHRRCSNKVSTLFVSNQLNQLPKTCETAQPQRHMHDSRTALRVITSTSHRRCRLTPQLLSVTVVHILLISQHPGAQLI
ncbi:hypothetical protein K505DRAFT_30187 [Melanomma pulvis-pyrius CBS 109.77]|uniref:Uncharacterized protein n=1 Tax=Melanomma pulvis-pyrius CBS 109.77 TaxID=1314802 RepID=A0A6A6XES8_9PLEO|nr:hypothetical protein K505DRAFT_30187 [Melanomma pulvis-pyrius CBS 109.77]